MKRVLKGLAVLVMLALFAFMLTAWWFLRWDEIDPPELPGMVASDSLVHDGLSRTWTSYVPSSRADSPALLILLHGSLGNGDFMRASTFFEFDILAERNGFVVAYPDGFEQHWNDCRASAAYSANVRKIDDVGFLQAMIDKLVAEQGVDPEQVYAAGLSNGGHMAFRLGLEAPELVAGIAAYAANLPVADNLDCEPRGVALPVLVINGTEDPVNPYAGGLVEIFGDASRGSVRSAAQTVQYWAELAGYGGAGQQVNWPETSADDDTSVRSLSWSAPGLPAVQLLSVVGGGHTFPHPLYKQSRFAGTTSHEFNGAQVTWQFFSQGLPVAAGAQ